MARVKSIKYDGAYPNLCSGTLRVVTSMGLPLVEKVWVFPSYCMRSGVSEHVEYGDWSINDWPEGFPEDLKQDVVSMVNAKVPHGCCGGCI